MQGRDSEIAKDEDMNLDGDMLSELCCPIYQEPYQEATLYTDGRVYSRAAITEYKKNNPWKAKESPITRQPFAEVKFADGAQHVLKEKFATLITEYRQKQQEWRDKIERAEKEEKATKEKLASTEKELVELRQKLKTFTEPKKVVATPPAAIATPIEESLSEFTFYDVSLPDGYLKHSFHNMRFDHAIKKRNLFEARYYLSQGADPNTTDHETLATALIQVVIKRKEDPERALDIIYMLLTHPSINLDAHDHRGNTALHHAAMLNDRLVVDLLLAKNANINLLNNFGATACQVGQGVNKENFDRMIFNKLNVGVSPHQSAGQHRLFTTRKAFLEQPNTRSNRPLMHCVR